MPCCLVKTGNKTHDDACLAAEMIRQVAVAAGGNNQTAVTAAEVQYYKTVRDSAFNNGLPHADFMQALRNLGVARVNPIAP
jgi:hypothetical protein